ncbi:hypothetical protein, partial [Mycobacterium tuberculosis]
DVYKRQIYGRRMGARKGSLALSSPPAS